VKTYTVTITGKSRPLKEYLKSHRFLWNNSIPGWISTGNTSEDVARFRTRTECVVGVDLASEEEKDVVPGIGEMSLEDAIGGTL